jgi:hypothetical protein
MKTFVLLGIASAAMFMAGCRTVAVVDNGGPVYARSGYYGDGYYRSRPYYGSGYRYSRSYRTPYYGSRYSGSRGYYGNRSYYGSRGYYGAPRSGATIVVR